MDDNPNSRGGDRDRNQDLRNSHLRNQKRGPMEVSRVLLRVTAGRQVPIVSAYRFRSLSSRRPRTLGSAAPSFSQGPVKKQKFGWTVVVVVGAEARRDSKVKGGDGHCLRPSRTLPPVPCRSDTRRPVSTTPLRETRSPSHYLLYPPVGTSPGHSVVEKEIRRDKSTTCLLCTKGGETLSLINPLIVNFLKYLHLQT